MRLAVLSDIHGNLTALQAVLNDLKQVDGVDKIWVLGDLVLLGSHPAECLQLIRNLPNAEVIGGNTDRYVVNGYFEMHNKPKNEEEFANFLPTLRAYSDNLYWTLSKLSFADFEYLSKILHRGLEVKVPGFGWVVGYHGSPGNDDYFLNPDTPDEEVIDQFLDADACLGFGGHTHLPMNREFGQLRVVNVGSIGLPKDERRACYVIADITAEGADIRFRRVDYDYDAALKNLRDSDNPAVEAVIKLLTGNWISA